MKRVLLVALLALPMSVVVVFAFDGICPRCQQLGLKSTVTLIHSDVLPHGSPRVNNDENGNRHDEDMDTYVYIYTCSQLHGFQVQKTQGKETIRSRNGSENGPHDSTAGIKTVSEDIRKGTRPSTGTNGIVIAPGKH